MLGVGAEVVVTAMAGLKLMASGFYFNGASDVAAFVRDLLVGLT